ncbi:uncharacterized protein SCHCODRAFT_01168533 [Schizophyllum commune H4-8]|uniref:uncharacterized protein n=1 Tax=Schizophyllum commune (strain H4-8 / FGSC 9210) TaxID=578458 RepID=UPI0021604A5C|nr:uncharacterized protein SCHCODRAFT_01168533 [Schizophyllum commune H4-8]KAI5899757.1 hypothetical protein SCHCODRAFT_01168533 [Schizophyllum commune H4-8]
MGDGRRYTPTLNNSRPYHDLSSDVESSGSTQQQLPPLRRRSPDQQQALPAGRFLAYGRPDLTADPRMPLSPASYGTEDYCGGSTQYDYERPIEGGRASNIMSNSRLPVLHAAAHHMQPLHHRSVSQSSLGDNGMQSESEMSYMHYAVRSFV